MLSKVKAWVMGLLALIGVLATALGIKGLFNRRPAPVLVIPGASAAKQEAEEQGKREERAQTLEERLQALLSGTLALLLVFCASAGPARAADALPPAENQVYIPQTYDELLKYYKEAIYLLQQYHDLYAEAEASNKALLKANEELRSLAAEQQKMLMKGLDRKPLSFLGGAIATPSGTGVLLGVSWSP